MLGGVRHSILKIYPHWPPNSKYSTRHCVYVAVADNDVYSVTEDPARTVSNVKDLQRATRCVIRKTEFVSSNALFVSWNTKFHTDCTTVCLMRLVDVTGNDSTRRSCDEHPVVFELLLPASRTVRFLVYNVSMKLQQSVS